MNQDVAITFSEVQFVPQYSEVLSRSDVDVSTDMVKFKLNLPIISANMKDITGYKMAIAMMEHGGLGILHRFNSIEEACTEYLKVFETLIKEKDYFRDPPLHINDLSMLVGVSIGVHEEDKKRLERLYNVGARLFTIDVAHGHHILVKNMLKWIRTNKNNDICLIAGNVATPEGARDLVEWGADIVKVGIGPGEVCQTRKNTGVGLPQLSVLSEIRQSCPNIIMIADGGIKSTGDIGKALKYANAVMLGNFIAGTSETPGHVYESPNNELYKVYGGSASGERKVENGGENTFVEGVIKMVKFNGHVKYILRKIKQNLQSSFSYSGAMNLKEFHEKAILRRISSGGKQESKI